MKINKIERGRRLLIGAAFFIFVLTQALSSPTLAADSDGIAGVWWTPEHDGKIAISLDATGVASGRLIAVSPEDANAVDANNPDTALRFRTLLGLPILQGFSLDTDGRLTGGTIYDPDTGKTYYGTLTFDRDGHLLMKGSVFFSFFARTEVMQRVEGPDPAAHQDGEPDLVYVAP